MNQISRAIGLFVLGLGSSHAQESGVTPTYHKDVAPILQR